MFTLQNLNMIHLLGESCKGELRFKNTSPLGKLMNVNELDVENLGDLLLRFKDDTAHEEFMSALEDEVVGILQARIKFIRNDVVSMIEDLNETITTKVDDNLPLLTGTKVAVAYTPRILTSELLLGMTEQHVNAIIKTVDFGKAFPEMFADELVSLITANYDVDTVSMINELIDSMNVNIVDIYNKNFRNITTKGYPLASELVKPSYTQFIHLERAVVYLMANAFYKEPLETVNLPLAKYNALLSEHVASTGKQLATSIKLLSDSYRTSNKLLVYVDYSGSSEGTIVLNRKQYDLILEVDGCTPETILGMHSLNVLNKIHLSDADDALNLVDTIAKANVEIQRVSNYKRSILNNNRTTTVMRVILEEINRIIDAKEFIVPEGKTKSDVINSCRAIISEYGMISPDKLYYFIRKVVCLGLYPNSGAFKYLTSMDTHQLDNPNLKPREAATLALRDTLVEWDIAQLM